MNSIKVSLLAYLANLRGSLDHANDGNTVALVDRAAHALGLIEDHKFVEGPIEPVEPLQVTEGHIGAAGYEHLTEADIGTPLDQVTHSTDAPPDVAPPPPPAAPVV